MQVTNISQFISAQLELGRLSPPPAAAGASIDGTILNIVNFATASGAVIFFLLFVWGCIEWITSQGDKTSLGKARGRITHAFIGFILLTIVWVIFFIVRSITYNTP